MLEVCIFCKKECKYYKVRRDTIHVVNKITTLDRLQTKTLSIGNNNLCEFIERARSKGEDILYHTSCKNQLESTRK